eukprot:gene10923-3628_t
MIKLSGIKWTCQNSKPKPKSIKLFNVDHTEFLSDKLFKKHRTTIIFGTPSPFTSATTMKEHIPEILKWSHHLYSKADLVAVISVSDPFVMKYWSDLFKGKMKRFNSEPHAPIHILCDPISEFTNHLGLGDDRTEEGLGINSKRYSAIIKNGEIVKLNIEKHRDDFRLSGPNRILDQIENMKVRSYEY